MVDLNVHNYYLHAATVMVYKVLNTIFVVTFYVQGSEHQRVVYKVERHSV